MLWLLSALSQDADPLSEGHECLLANALEGVSGRGGRVNGPRAGPS